MLSRTGEESLTVEALSFLDAESAVWGGGVDQSDYKIKQRPITTKPLPLCPRQSAGREAPGRSGPRDARLLWHTVNS